MGGQHSLGASTGRRADIQGLRAIAVLLVLTYHAFPEAIPGGYVGVDVFFVISGFLITGHILGEMTRTGSVRIARFWARRARRLLPASMLVLLASAIATMLFVPRHLWQQFLSEIGASAIYMQNWLLASSSTDYMGSANNPSVVQHFWSLSVEEQFYIALPLIVLGVTLVASRERQTATLRALFVLVLIGSLAYSVALTATSPSVAYFATTTRAWEFAAGGMMAFFAFKIKFPQLITWLGLGAICGSALFYNEATQFPGIAAALPVAGTIAVIASRGIGADWILAPKPVQYMGDISYSAYLWHWPILVLLPFILGRELSPWMALLGLLASVLLAALTKTFVEDPFRAAPKIDRHWPSFTLAFISAALIVSVSTAGMLVESKRVEAVHLAVKDAAASAADSTVDCWGASESVNDCAVQPLVGDASAASLDMHAIEAGNCNGGSVVSPIGDGLECEYGVPEGRFNVVLVGDSHARQWMPALEDIAVTRGWKITTLVRSSCPFGDLNVELRAGIGIDSACASWRQAALSRILEIEPDLVIASAASAYAYEILGGSIGDPDTQVAGYGRYLEQILDAGIPVVALKDNPYLPISASDCVSTGAVCEFPQAEVLDNSFDAMSMAALQLEATVVNFDHIYCPERSCKAVIGGVIVYQDRHHITQTFALSLSQYLDASLAELAEEVPSRPIS